MASTAKTEETKPNEIELPPEILNASVEEIQARTKFLENEIRSLKVDCTRLTHEQARERKKIEENMDKIKLNKQLPYLVGHVVEVNL
jgi:26S proteasome regulatory subunit T5